MTKSQSTSSSADQRIQKSLAFWQNENSRYDGSSAMVALDRATGWMVVFPQGRRSTEDAVQSFQLFFKSPEKVTHVYSDNGAEIIVALRHLMAPRNVNPKGASNQWSCGANGSLDEGKRSWKHYPAGVLTRMVGYSMSALGDGKELCAHRRRLCLQQTTPARTCSRTDDTLRM